MVAEAIDQARLEAFMNTAIGNLSGATATILGSIGDRLGFFKNLAADGPATSTEFAERTDTNERYVREWLSGMASAGYIDYDPATQRFALPPEHAPLLADEGGPMFMGGFFQMLPAMQAPLDQIIAAFQQGGGVPQAVYAQSFWDGFERFSNGWFENLLVQQWLPAVPAVQAALERGATVADIGCGRGRALIKLAQAFPRSRFTGYDAYAPTIGLAGQNAAEAGVADRVRFVHHDVAQGLPEQFDLITTFDVVHDAVDPRGLLRAIRQALKAGGTYLCLEVACSDRLEENAGPLGTLLYSSSILYCMTTSLAQGGEGLGTMGLPEPVLRSLCTEAGFSAVHRVPFDNPFNSLYAITP